MAARGMSAFGQLRGKADADPGREMVAIKLTSGRIATVAVLSAVQQHRRTEELT